MPEAEGEVHLAADVELRMFLIKAGVGAWLGLPGSSSFTKRNTSLDAVGGEHRNRGELKAIRASFT